MPPVPCRAALRGASSRSDAPRPSAALRAQPRAARAARAAGLPASPHCGRSPPTLRAGAAATLRVRAWSSATLPALHEARPASQPPTRAAPSAPL
eukprot:scaffold28336_cov69-Phaeocystis_antarctica.AAC.8